MASMPDLIGKVTMEPKRLHWSWRWPFIRLEQKIIVSFDQAPASGQCVRIEVSYGCEGCRRDYPKNEAGQHVWPSSGIGGGAGYRECTAAIAGGHCSCGALLWFLSERDSGYCQKCAPKAPAPSSSKQP